MRIFHVNSVHPENQFHSPMITDVEIDVWLAMIKKWMKWFESFPTKHQKTKLVEQMIRIHDAKMWEGSGTSDFTMAVWGNIS